MRCANINCQYFNSDFIQHCSKATLLRVIDCHDFFEPVEESEMMDFVAYSGPWYTQEVKRI